MALTEVVCLAGTAMLVPRISTLISPYLIHGVRCAPHGVGMAWQQASRFCWLLGVVVELLVRQGRRFCCCCCCCCCCWFARPVVLEMGRFVSGVLSLGKESRFIFACDVGRTKRWWKKGLWQTACRLVLLDSIHFPGIRSKLGYWRPYYRGWMKSRKSRSTSPRFILFCVTYP